MRARKLITIHFIIITYAQRLISHNVCVFTVCLHFDVSESATVGYGLNRADWSYIPGGVISGTALIRPDFPELLVWPYLWQQTEYVLGGGSSHYMFLVLAVRNLL